MKKLLQLGFIILFGSGVSAQKKATLNFQEVQRIETTLAANDMKGRKAGTEDIELAAGFISGEFEKAGLQPLIKNSGRESFIGSKFLQPFSMIRSKPEKVKGELNGVELDPGNIVVISTQPELKFDEKSGYDIQYIVAGESFGTRARALARSEKNTLVIVDTSFTRNFSRLSSLGQQLFSMKNSVVFVLSTSKPVSYKIKAELSVTESKFANVVGIIPGKSRKNEYVIFSAHYDHLGIAKQPLNGDSIYNGANDDAAGTTAVIALAGYFSNLKNNERTLVFAAFTAEEIGGFGSQYFSKQFDPAQVIAMFNIEMIGTESKWGKNSAYITGFDKTDMGTLLQKNLSGSGFTFYPDPYEKENLFYRSDNATLARLGVPAHTISTAKMENEPNYHKLSDEVSTLDLKNMTAIIEAIALSSKSIVSGQDTPSRVKQESLR